MTPVQKRLKQTLDSLTSMFDDQAKETVEYLVKRMGHFQRISHDSTGNEAELGDVLSFHSTKGWCMVFSNKLSNPEAIAQTAVALGKQQFRTHDEDRMYCAGTKELLELLTQYRSIRTENAIIMAIPEARISGGTGDDLRAFINASHLRTMYGTDRSVTIVVAAETGYVIFKFEEIAVVGKLPPWLTMDETVEEV